MLVSWFQSIRKLWSMTQDPGACSGGPGLEEAQSSAHTPDHRLLREQGYIRGSLGLAVQVTWERENLPEGREAWSS